MAERAADAVFAHADWLVCVCHSNLGTKLIAGRTVIG